MRTRSIPVPSSCTVNRVRAGCSRNWLLSPTSGVSVSSTWNCRGVTVLGSKRAVPEATGTNRAPLIPSAATTSATGSPNAIRPAIRRRRRGSGVGATSSIAAACWLSSRITRTTTSSRVASRYAAVTGSPAAGRLAVNSSPTTSASRVGAAGARTARVRSASAIDATVATKVTRTGVISRSAVTSAGSPTLSIRAQPCSSPVPRLVAVRTVGTPWSRVSR